VCWIEGVAGVLDGLGFAMCDFWFVFLCVVLGVWSGKRCDIISGVVHGGLPSVTPHSAIRFSAVRALGYGFQLFEFRFGCLGFWYFCLVAHVTIACAPT